MLALGVGVGCCRYHSDDLPSPVATMTIAARRVRRSMEQHCRGQRGRADEWFTSRVEPHPGARIILFTVPLQPGTCLGPYESRALIGAGGMGEVYRVRDSKLKRDVTFKVLPEAVAREPERIARFEREAEVLASLNHANIAVVHENRTQRDLHPSNRFGRRPEAAVVGRRCRAAVVARWARAVFHER